MRVAEQLFDSRVPLESSQKAGDTQHLSRDDIFHILQTKRRRDVLRYLQTRTEPVELGELAEQIAAWEQETTVDQLHSTERQRVYISLYQSHLPKLDNRGIVDYDKDRGFVTKTPLAAQLEPYLEETRPNRTPWPRRYGAVTLCCTLFFVVAATGVVPVSGWVSAVVILLAFAAVTTAHVVAHR